MSKKIARIDIQHLVVWTQLHVKDVEEHFGIKQGLGSKDAEYLTHLLIDQFINARMAWTRNPEYRYDELKHRFGKMWDIEEFREMILIARDYIQEYLMVRLEHIFVNPRVWKINHQYTAIYQGWAMYLLDDGPVAKKQVQAAIIKPRDPNEITVGRLSIRTDASGQAVIRYNPVEDPIVNMNTINVIITPRVNLYASCRQPDDKTDEEFERMGMEDLKHGRLEPTVYYPDTTAYQALRERLVFRRLALGEIAPVPAPPKTYPNRDTLESMAASLLGDRQLR